MLISTQGWRQEGHVSKRNLGEGRGRKDVTFRDSPEITIFLKIIIIIINPGLVFRGSLDRAKFPGHLYVCVCGICVVPDSLKQEELPLAAHQDEQAYTIYKEQRDHNRKIVCTFDSQGGGGGGKIKSHMRQTFERNLPRPSTQHDTSFLPSSQLLI